MSEAERMDVDRRAFLKRFALGAAVLPVMVSNGVFRIPDIGGWGPGGRYGYGHAYGYGHGRGPVF